MALCYDPPVYKDAYRLILKSFAHATDFPREHKRALGQDLKRDSITPRARRSIGTPFCTTSRSSSWRRASAQTEGDALSEVGAGSPCRRRR